MPQDRNIWVIGCTHFGHENIIKYCDRPFDNAVEMNECMVDNWNETVKDGDIVYHVGDVFFGAGGRDSLARLKGRKRLILGNHDNGKDRDLQAFFQKIQMWRMFPDMGLLLTHVPVHESTLSENPNRAKLKNIHAHTHLNGEPDGDTVNYKSVTVELNDYRPVNIEELRIR